MPEQARRLVEQDLIDQALAQERGVEQMTGFEVQLVASEPAIQKPMNLAFDERGRVWVTGSSSYPWPAKRDALGQPIAAFTKQWDENPVAFRATSTPPTSAGRNVAFSAMPVTMPGSAMGRTNRRDTTLRPKNW